MLARVTACNIHERPQYLDKDDHISDHAPLSIQIQTNGPKWQLDVFLLKDEACMEKLSCIIKTISRIKTKTRKGSLWPGVKIRLLCEAIAFRNEWMQICERSREVEHMEMEGN